MIPESKQKNPLHITQGQDQFSGGPSVARDSEIAFYISKNT